MRHISKISWGKAPRSPYNGEDFRLGTRPQTLYSHNPHNPGVAPGDLYFPIALRPSTTTFISSRPVHCIVPTSVNDCIDCTAGKACSIRYNTVQIQYNTIRYVVSPALRQIVAAGLLFTVVGRITVGTGNFWLFAYLS